MGRQAKIVDFEQAKSASTSARSSKRSNTISGSARKPPAPPSKEKTSAPRPRVQKVAADTSSSRRRGAAHAKAPASNASYVKVAPEKAKAASGRAKLSDSQKARTKSTAAKAAQKRQTSSKAAQPSRTAKSPQAKRAQTAKNSVLRAEDMPREKEIKDPGFLDKLDKRRHDARKKKADRAFDRNVKTDPAPSGTDEGAPRAALYQTKMGSSHKRSARMQNEQSAFALPSVGFDFSSLASRFSGRSQRFYVACTVVVCVLLSGAFLYPTAQNYYTAVRNQQKVSAEYAAIEARNSTLQDDISDLSTQAGIEDRAREQYGWVKQGENAVRVSGLSTSSDTSINSVNLVTVGAVSAPDTWYSGILDTVFGYRK